MTNSEIDNIPKIALPDKEGMSIYEVKKIIRCTSDNSYTEFLMLDDSGNKKDYSKKMVSRGIYHFEEYLLSTGYFFRVHNQYIINVMHLKRIIRNNGSYVLMDDNTGERIPIARARKEDFLNYLKEKGIMI
jgi:two-component system, LytTR family, response regulator